MGKEALSANQGSFGRNSCRSESYLISHRAHGGLGETPLWIGEMPIQSRAFGPILPRRELGQGSHALLFHFVDSEGSSDPRETGSAGESLCHWGFKESWGHAAGPGLRIAGRRF